MKHRYHVLGVPHTITNAEFCACAYTQKARLFCRMMTERGHHVIHYGHPDSDVVCTEHVDVISRETFNRVYGDHDWKTHLFKFATDDDVYQEYYRNACAEIWKRKPNKIWMETCTDFLLPFWNGLKPIADAHSDMIVVEPGIGYSSGHYAPYKIFESHALMHAYYGLDGGRIGYMPWSNTVIPNYFDPDEYRYSETKEDHLLFLGRVGEAKGVNIAIQVSDHTGVPLHIYGQGAEEYRKIWEADNGPTGENIKWMGYADKETRKEAFANARALILPGKYLEPFGGTQVQALLSGTPLITSNWGAYAEVNREGVGFRCNSFRDFVEAVKKVKDIDPRTCRERGMRYSMDSIAPMYEKHFNFLMDLRGPDGWYTTGPQ